MHSFAVGMSVQKSGSVENYVKQKSHINTLTTHIMFE